MTDLIDAFAQLEHRGETRSADTILAQVAAELDAGRVRNSASKLRVRIGQSPKVWAAVGTFVAVLTTGILMSTAIGGRTDPSSVESADQGAPPSTFTLSVAGNRIQLPEGAYPTAIAQHGASLLVLAGDVPLEPGGVPSETGTLLQVDPQTGQGDVIATLDDYPLDLVVVADYAWVTHWKTGALTRVPLASGVAPVSVNLPAVDGFPAEDGRAVFLPNGIEAADGIVWVLTARGALVGLHADSGETYSMFELEPFHPLELSLGVETVWIAADTRGIEWVDLETGVKERIPVSQLAHLTNHVAAFGRKAFVSGQVSGPPATTVAHAVSLVDADDHSAVRVLESDTPIVSLGVVGSDVVAVSDSGTYWVIAEDGTVSSPQTLGSGIASRIVFDEGNAWSIDYETHTVTALELRPRP